MRIIVLMQLKRIFRSAQPTSSIPSPGPNSSSSARSFCPLKVGGALLACLCHVATAQATVTTLSFQPNPTDMSDLDHHLAYTWRRDNVYLNGMAITGTTLSFTNISNRDTNRNVLHPHLLDTAINPGVASFLDNPTRSVPVVDLTNDFISARYHSDPKWLVKAGTGDTFLADKSFPTTGVNYTYNFTASQLQTVASYHREQRRPCSRARSRLPLFQRRHQLYDDADPVPGDSRPLSDPEPARGHRQHPLPPPSPQCPAADDRDQRALIS
ncbi:MAG: hypothetical protein ABIR29_12065 [Chthoniobacterales bacterium]